MQFILDEFFENFGPGTVVFAKRQSHRGGFAKGHDSKTVSLFKIKFPVSEAEAVDFNPAIEEFSGTRGFESIGHSSIRIFDNDALA